MTKLEKLIEFLNEELEITSVYTGGGDDDNYLSFTNSLDVDRATKNKEIEYIAKDILKVLK